MQNLINATLNTIFVSIPEEFVWVVFTLILLKRWDLLDIYRWKYNLKQIMIPVIPVAIAINLMRYVLHINSLVNFITIEIMMCCLVIYLIKKNNFLQEKINYIKIILSVLLADFIIILMTEIISVLSIVFIFNLNINEINNNVVFNIVLSILPRILQILIITYCIYKQNAGKMINHIEVISKNKILSVSTAVFIFTVVITIVVFARFIYGMQYLSNYILITKLLLLILLVLIPVILISSYFISICNLLYENSKLQREKENIYDDIL